MKSEAGTSSEVPAWFRRRGGSIGCLEPSAANNRQGFLMRF